MLLRACEISEDVIDNIVIVDDLMIGYFNLYICPETAEIGDKLVNGVLIKSQVSTNETQVITDEEIEELIRQIEYKYEENHNFAV